MKTQTKIENEIKKLRILVDKVPESTAFGESNHTAIEAQILALEKQWSESDAWDDFGDDDENRDRTYAIEAIWWMREENNQDAPSDGWAELAR